MVVGAPDRDRFTQLAREHTTAVGNYLRRRLYPLTPADLDDLVEETLLVVWRRLEDVPPDAERAWILGVARNVLRNARRAKNRRQTLQSSLAPPRDDRSAEEYVVADVSVREALAALSEGDREILLLNAWDGLDTASLAAYFGVSPNAAAVRLSRAQRRFREHLDAGVT